MSPRVRIALRRLGGQSGQTVVELSVSMVILGMVMAVFLGVLVVVQTALGRESVRSSTVDEARLGMEALDREIRSGNILCEQSGYYGLSVYTQSNGTARWVQYRVQSGQLQRRQYTAGSWGAWRALAHGIVNSTPPATTIDVPFKLDTSATSGFGSAAGSRTVNVILLAHSDTSDATSSAVRLQSSLSIRNQSTAVPCASLPSG